MKVSWLMHDTSWALRGRFSLGDWTVIVLAKGVGRTDVRP